MVRMNSEIEKWLNGSEQESAFGRPGPGSARRDTAPSGSARSSPIFPNNFFLFFVRANESRGLVRYD